MIITRTRQRTEIDEYHFGRRNSAWKPSGGPGGPADVITFRTEEYAKVAKRR